MSRLAKMKPRDLQPTRGPEVGLGEATLAGLRLAMPRVGFLAGGEELEQIVRPSWDSIGALMEAPGGSMLSDEVRQQIGFLSKEEFDADADQYLQLVRDDLTEQGVEIPEALQAEAYQQNRAGVIGEAKANIETQQEILSRASPNKALFGQFLGGLAAEFTDPINLATIPIGATGRMGLLATMGAEGAINAAIEGAQTPGRNRFERLMGEEESSLAGNMAMGATFGVVTGGAVKGAQMSAPRVSEFTSKQYSRIGAMLSREDRASIAADASESINPDMRQAGAAVGADLDDEVAAVSNPNTDTVAEHRERGQQAYEATMLGGDTLPPDRPLFAQPEQSLHGGEIVALSHRDIEVQPDVFQFKSDTVQAGGVTEKLLPVTEWRSERAGVAIVYEYSNGTRAIADGHQRLALARRISEQTGEDIQLTARIYREEDGFTPEDMRVHAALKNIAEAADGMTARMAGDAAKVLRIRPEAISQLPAGPGIARAQNLSKLSDDAFQLYINEVVPERFAEIVGREVSDPALHAPMMRLLERTSPPTTQQAESIVRQALEAPVDRTTEVDLFGEREVTESLYLERAKVLEAAMSTLHKDRTLFRTLDDRAGQIESTGENRLDSATNKEIRERTEQALAIIKAQAHRAGPISEALNDGAKKYKETGKIKEAAAGVAEAVRREIADNGLTGDGGRDVGRAAKPTDADTTTPDPNEGFADPVEGAAAQSQIDATRDALNDPPEGSSFDAVPVGRAFDADGNEVAVTMTHAELRADLDADDDFLAQMDVCFKG